MKKIETKAELAHLPVLKVSESPSNIRGSKFEDESFKDLVASVEQSGVLVPILVRETKDGHYEAIAGNRRLRAAKQAGLILIPAMIAVMGDAEAQEAQIVENLQRKDVHPLDEALAYRQLIEKRNYDIPSIAAKVGKSQSYIKARILLTNLCKEAIEEYRKGAITDGHAQEIARLSPEGDQQKTLTYIRDQVRYGKAITTKDLHDWAEELFVELAFQPWLKDKKAMAAVGACVECPKDSSSLFGEVKEGACTTTRCAKRKIVKYIKWAKEQDPDLFIVRGDYGQHSPGVLGYSSFDRVKKGSKDAKKALIVEGTGRGKTIYIKTRSAQVALMSPEEKQKHEKKMTAEREKRNKQQALQQKKEDEKMIAGIAKVSWPIKETALDALFLLALDRSNSQEEVIRRLKIDVKRDEQGDVEDPEKELRAYYQKASAVIKARIVFDLFISEAWGNEQSKILKSL